MKKITVKRFLNKRIKPVQVYDDVAKLGYPLYYSITYDRKTQNIKSLSGAVMTVKAFNHLKETGEPYYKETNYSNTGFNTVKLIDELEYIQKAVSFIVNDRKQRDIFNSDFTNTLKEYFNSLKDALFFIGWLKYDFNINNLIHKKKSDKNSKIKEPLTVSEILRKTQPTKEQQRIITLYGGGKDVYYNAQSFYYSFNKEQNLLMSINQIESVTGKDLKPYFFKDTLKLWYVINLVLQSYKNDALKIDFILNFDTDKYIKQNKKFGYSVTDNEIILISKDLKYKALIF